MRIVVHREIPDDRQLQEQWNTLATRMLRPQIFYTWEWAIAIQTAYRDLSRPFLILGYEGRELVGILSLACDARGKEFTFLAANTADYCDFLAVPEWRGEFVDATLGELRRHGTRRLSLANVPADSLGLADMKSRCSQQGFYFHSRPAYSCAQVDLGEGEQRRRLKTELSGKKKIRRYLREMEREGPVSFEHLQSFSEIDAAIPGFAQSHIARFEATKRVSSLAKPERRAFLAELARRFDGKGVITLSQLKVGCTPVAWNYGFQFNGSWFWYQPTFDSLQEKNSPGYCLLARMIIDACDMPGMQEVDLGLGDEGYKERFGNNVRETLHVTLTTSCVSHFSTQARYRAASNLKRSPRIEKIMRRLLKRGTS